MSLLNHCCSFTFSFFPDVYTQPSIVKKQLKIERFLVSRFAERNIEGIKQNLQWVSEGKLKYREHITYGFENAPDAFRGLFTGDNTGKSLVKLL